MNKYTLIALAVSLSGCMVTAPGSLSPDDFETQAVKIARPATHAASSFHDDLGRCKGGDQITHCGPVRPNGSITCDVYIAGAFWGPAYVLGRVDFVPASSGETAAEFGFNRMSFGSRPSNAYIKDWIRYASGQGCEAKR